MCPSVQAVEPLEAAAKVIGSDDGSSVRFDFALPRNADIFLLASANCKRRLHFFHERLKIEIVLYVIYY